MKMEVSSSLRLQPARLPALRASGGWSSGRRKSSRVAFASANLSGKDLSLESKVGTLLDSVIRDDKGLAVAIAQNLAPRLSQMTTILNWCLLLPDDICFSYLRATSGLHIVHICHPIKVFVKKVGTLLDNVKWDDKGLAVAIAQNVDTGAILMQGFVNRDALADTISTRKATFYSRSRSSLWTKGETSTNFINISDVFLDCDRDSIIYLGKPDGPTCHTGSETCYFSSIEDILEPSQVTRNELALSTLYSLESIISRRKAESAESQDGKPSWTKRLLLDNKLLCSKVREEADELCRTLEENEDKARTASEMADVLYHSMVLLAVRDVKMEEVLEILRHRFSQSGIEEKIGRTKG